MFSHSSRSRLDSGCDALTMDQAVRNGVTFMGSQLMEAMRIASETPAELLGVFEKGRVTLGTDADLVVLSTEGTVEETIVAGETVYDWRGENHVR